MITNIAAAKEEIREQVDLASVVEAYGIELQPIATNDVGGLCPFHDEDTPSFAVSTEKQVYFCYGCKAKGDVFSFVQSMEGIGFVDAIHSIAEAFGVDIQRFMRPMTEAEKELQVLYEAMEDRATQAVEDRGKDFAAYMKKRQIPESIYDLFQIGWSDDADQDYDGPLEFDKRAKWHHAVVVPIRDFYGRIVAFRNRPLMKGAAKVQASSKDMPLEQPLVYGFDVAKSSIMESGGQAYIVEGEADLWQMFAHGYTNTICSLGSSMKADTIRALHEQGVTELVFLPDQDKAGREYARSVAKLRIPGVSIKIAGYSASDPDEALKADPELFAQEIKEETNGIEYIIRHASSFRKTETITQKLDVLSDVKRTMGSMTKAEAALAAEIAEILLGVHYETAFNHLMEVEQVGKLHDLQLEKKILAAAMSDMMVCGEIVNALRPEDFYLPNHQRIARAIWKLYMGSADVDRVSVGTKLEDPKILDSIPDTGRADSYSISAVRDLAQKRSLVDLGRNISSLAHNREHSAVDAANDAMAGLSRIVVGSHEVAGMEGLVHSMMDTVLERVKNPNIIIGQDLGDQFRTIHGFQRNRYMVVAGGSGAGKTALAGAMVRHLAIKYGTPSLVLSFETGKEVLTQRFVAGHAGVDMERVSTGRLSKDEFDKLSQAAAEIGASPIYFTESGRTYEEAAAIIRHSVLTQGVENVVIDYIQLMELANPDRGMNRYREVGQVSGGLLQLTQELNLRMIAVAQLNRDGAKKGGASGGHDVGESFRIYQDADIFVSFMERSEEHVEKFGPKFGNRVMKIDKNRKDGKDDVSCYLLADLKTQSIREVDTNE